MENQILKAINHIKYISMKKFYTNRIFNYLQKSLASNYDYHSGNGITDDSCKIIKPVLEVMNFVTEDEMNIYSNSPEIVGTILMGLFKAYVC